jgi:hypothetical protein
MTRHNGPRTRLLAFTFSKFLRLLSCITNHIFVALDSKGTHIVIENHLRCLQTGEYKEIYVHCDADSMEEKSILLPAQISYMP